MIRPGAQAGLSQALVELASNQQALVTATDELWRATNAELAPAAAAAHRRLRLGRWRARRRRRGDPRPRGGRDGDGGALDPAPGKASRRGDGAAARRGHELPHALYLTLERDRRDRARPRGLPPLRAELDLARRDRELKLEEDAAKAAQIAVLADSVALVVASARRGDFSRRAHRRSRSRPPDRQSWSASTRSARRPSAFSTISVPRPMPTPRTISAHASPPAPAASSTSSRAA
jgi:hypothetical protein